MSKKLDRPDREKIARIIWMDGSDDATGWLSSIIYHKKMGKPYQIADQIINLIVDKLTVIEATEEEPWASACLMAADAQLQHTIKEIKGK